MKKYRKTTEWERLRYLFKKIGDIKGIFHAKMGTIRDRNGKDLTDLEEIKKRCQENRTVQKKKQTNKQKKTLDGPDNHDSVVIHLEPDFLKCEVRWAFRSIVKNKASGGDRIPELFKILKMMILLKFCTQYASKFGKLSSGHKTGTCQFSFQFQRKAMLKNVQTTAQLHSSHTLAK